jgi:hypothetical protein
MVTAAGDPPLRYSDRRAERHTVAQQAVQEVSGSAPRPRRRRSMYRPVVTFGASDLKGICPDRIGQDLE